VKCIREGDETMTKQQIKELEIYELRAIVNSTNPTGKFAAEVVWAKEELNKKEK
jgi:hypothetical protein